MHMLSFVRLISVYFLLRNDCKRKFPTTEFNVLKVKMVKNQAPENVVGLYIILFKGFSFKVIVMV